MHTLEIHNFKAFGEDGVVFGASEPDFTKRPKNILCYGENGTGKTSIFEAIRWVFYTEAVINSRVPAALVGAARDNAIRQVYVDHNIGAMTGQQPFHAIALFYIVLPFVGVACMITWKYTRCCCKYALSAMVENVCDILDIEVTVRNRTREESRGTYKYTDYGNN